MVIAATSYHSLPETRTPPPNQAILTTIPRSRDYTDVFEALNRCDGVPNGFLPPYTPTTPEEQALSSIPPLTHWIWLGSSLEKEEYKVCIEKTCKAMPDHTKVIWTDQTSFSPDMKAFCQKNGIKIIFIDDVFGKDGLDLLNEELYESSRMGFPPNYGISSDVLRCNLLYYFGGVYLDVDIHPVAHFDPNEVLLRKRELLRINCKNDFLASPPRNAQMKRFLEETIPTQNGLKKVELSDRYRKDGYDRTHTWDIYRTISVTGPAAWNTLYAAEAEKGRTMTLLQPDLMEQCSFSYSWRAKKLCETLTEELANRLSRQILRDIQFNPQALPMHHYSIATPDSPAVHRVIKAAIKSHPALFKGMAHPLDQMLELNQKLKKEDIATIFNTYTEEEQRAWIKSHDGQTPLQYRQLVLFHQTLSKVLHPALECATPSYPLLLLLEWRNKTIPIQNALAASLSKIALKYGSFQLSEDLIKDILLKGNDTRIAELYDVILDQYFIANEEERPSFSELYHSRHSREGERSEEEKNAHNDRVSSLISLYDCTPTSDYGNFQIFFPSETLPAPHILGKLRLLRYPEPQLSVDELFGYQID